MGTQILNKLIKNKLLVVEFILLCICLPSVIITYRLAPYMFTFLWSASIYCWLVLRFKYHDHLKELWNWRAVTWANMQPILIRFVIACLCMFAFTYFYDPEKLFNIIRNRPQIIPYLLVMYPILSALPQEFIFCSFFFKRYHPFFTSERSKIIASAIVFAFAHVLFINWVAPALSLVAGIIFAMTYSKTRSLALVTIEHGLYGNFLFLVGLGWYFYGGAVGH